MRKASPELSVIFGEEFRRQIRRPSFTVLTLVLAAMMVIAIPVVPALLDVIFPAQTPDVDDDALASSPKSSQLGLAPPGLH